MYQAYVHRRVRNQNLNMPNPYKGLALSFLGVMCLGTLLLMLPAATNDGVVTPLVDAAFTAVSCVSVTGLATLDPYLHWSLFGKTVMVILIQLGGLGIMTFTTLVAIVLGHKVGLSSRLVLQEDVGQDGLRGLMRIVRRIAILTFAAEFVGGLIYCWQLYPYLGADAWYIGFFQSISAFCNAGFVFFDNTLPYVMATDWVFTLNTCALIILGGFGYMAVFDILFNWRKGFRSLSLHTKVMLSGGILLIVSGTLIILGLEWSNPQTLGLLSVTDKIQAAFFQAVSPRTAGFATLDYGKMHPTTLFVTIVLMFIGAGPNSTGGGIKISTVAVIMAAAASIFKPQQDIELFKRRIANQQVYKAIGITFFSMSLIILGTFILAWEEPVVFLKLLFEVTSAFGTVGLSTGITPELTVPSKWTLIFIMYAGRIGVLTLIGAIAMRARPSRPITYPEGSILM